MVNSLGGGGAWSLATGPLAGVRTPSPNGTVDKKDQALRERLGEFAAQVFYGKMIQQMQNSKLKGPYLHGGRGEEAFQAQLGMEIAKRMGRSPNDPLTNQLYKAVKRRDSGNDNLADR